MDVLDHLCKFHHAICVSGYFRLQQEHFNHHEWSTLDTSNIQDLQAQFKKTLAINDLCAISICVTDVPSTVYEWMSRQLLRERNQHHLLVYLCCICWCLSSSDVLPAKAWTTLLHSLQVQKKPKRLQLFLQIL